MPYAIEEQQSPRAPTPLAPIWMPRSSSVRSSSRFGADSLKSPDEEFREIRPCLVQFRVRLRDYSPDHTQMAADRKLDQSTGRSDFGARLGAQGPNDEIREWRIAIIDEMKDALRTTAGSIRTWVAEALVHHGERTAVTGNLFDLGIPHEIEEFETYYRLIGWWRGPFGTREAQNAVRHFWVNHGAVGAEWLIERIARESHGDVLDGVANLLADIGPSEHRTYCP